MNCDLRKGVSPSSCYSCLLMWRTETSDKRRAINALSAGCRAITSNRNSLIDSWPFHYSDLDGRARRATCRLLRWRIILKTGKQTFSLEAFEPCIIIPGNTPSSATVLFTSKNAQNSTYKYSARGILRSQLIPMNFHKGLLNVPWRT